MKTRLSIFLCVLLLCVGGASLWAGTKKDRKVPAPATNSVPALTEAQKQALQAIDDDAKKKAMPMALRLAAVVKEIYENMLADQPDEDLRARLANEMKEATWDLLSVKGQAIRDSVALLTPEQKQLVRTEMSKPEAPADLLEVLGKIFKPAGK